MGPRLLWKFFGDLPRVPRSPYLWSPRRPTSARLFWPCPPPGVCMGRPGRTGAVGWGRPRAGGELDADCVPRWCRPYVGGVAFISGLGRAHQFSFFLAEAPACACFAPPLLGPPCVHHLALPSPPPPPQHMRGSCAPGGQALNKCEVPPPPCCLALPPPSWLTGPLASSWLYPRTLPGPRLVRAQPVGLHGDLY